MTGGAVCLDGIGGVCSRRRVRWRRTRTSGKRRSLALAPHATLWRKTGECARSRLRLTPLCGGKPESARADACASRRFAAETGECAHFACFASLARKRAKRLRLTPICGGNRGVRALTLAPHADLRRKPGSARAHVSSVRTWLTLSSKTSLTVLRGRTAL